MTTPRARGAPGRTTDHHAARNRTDGDDQARASTPEREVEEFLKARAKLVTNWMKKSKMHANGVDTDEWRGRHSDEFPRLHRAWTAHSAVYPSSAEAELAAAVVAPAAVAPPGRAVHRRHGHQSGQEATER